MKTQYETRRWSKYAMEDLFEDGCQPETATALDGRDAFAADTVPALVEKLRAFVGCDDPEGAFLDVCDVPGRVDVKVMERKDGFPASKQDVEAWKRAEKRLWLANYTFYVERVARETVPLA